MIDRCVARTFDGYEYDECGKPANFAGLCSEHFKRRLEDVEQNLKEAEEKAERLRSELARLRACGIVEERTMTTEHQPGSPPVDLDELDKLHAKCTPGPLRVNRYDNEGYISYQLQSERVGKDDLDGFEVLGQISDEETPRARWDAEFFATVANAWAAVSAELRTLRARDAAARVAAKDFRDALAARQHGDVAAWKCAKRIELLFEPLGPDSCPECRGSGEEFRADLDVFAQCRACGGNGWKDGVRR